VADLFAPAKRKYPDTTLKLASLIFIFLTIASSAGAGRADEVPVFEHSRTTFSLGYARLDYHESWIDLSEGTAYLELDHSRFISMIEASATGFALFAPSHPAGYSMTYAGLDLRAGPFIRPSSTFLT
jgi:hypothetical protein